MAAESIFIPRSEWMKEIPFNGIILIKRFDNPFVRDKKDRALLLGERSASGPFTIKGRLVETDYGIGSRIAIKSEMMTLDLSVPERREFYAILSLTDQFSATVAKSKDKPTSNSAYYLENPEMEAIEWKKNKDREYELTTSIKKLGEAGLQRIGLWFGIKGTPNVIEVALSRKSETEKGRQELMDILWSPDREMLELIAVAQSKGDANQKKGLWKNSLSGVFSWNTTTIGLGMDEVIVYLKKNNDLYYEMRKLYLGDDFRDNLEPPKNPGVKVALKDKYNMELLKQLFVEKKKADGKPDWKLIKDTYAEQTNTDPQHFSKLKAALDEIGIY